MDVFFSQANYLEVLLWGGFFLFAIIALFLVAQFLKRSIAGSIRSRTVQIAMTLQDIEKMRASGQISDEEAKALKAAMSRKVVERVQAEQALKQQPAKAAAALATFAEAPPPPKQQAEVPAKPAAPAVPERLRRLAALPDIELDQMVASGFLPPEDRAAIARARGES